MTWNYTPKKQGRAKRRTPRLRFSPYAWAKLLYLRDRGPTEIGGFGLSDEDDPLLIVDLLSVKQRCKPVTVAFDDEAVADLYDELVDEGIHPSRFGRIWIHTHPGGCPLPSHTDEATFRRIFGRVDWAIMAIVAQNDATYTRLAFHVGPGGGLEIPVSVDFEQPFDGADWQAWEDEYLAHVQVEPPALPCLPDPFPAAPFVEAASYRSLEPTEFYDGFPGWSL